MVGDAKALGLNHADHVSWICDHVSQSQDTGKVPTRTEDRLSYSDELLPIPP